MTAARTYQLVAELLRLNTEPEFNVSYNDKYLEPLVTVQREQEAIDYVDSLGTIPTPWRERLIVLRAYIIVCTESIKSSDDIFSAKLKAYRQEYADCLNRARDAAERAGDEQLTILPEYSLSATLER